MLPENVPTATVKLDKERRIAFTLGAMRRIKEATNKDLETALDETTLFETLGPIIWALLVKEDREGLTAADVEDMIAPSMIGTLVEAVGKLATGSVDAAEGKAEAATAAS